MFFRFFVLLACLFLIPAAQAASPCSKVAGGDALFQTPWIINPGKQVFCSLDAASTPTIAFYFNKCSKIGLLPMDAVTDVKSLETCDREDCSGATTTVNSATTIFVSGAVGGVYGRLTNITGISAATVILYCAP